jgi:hypothetical protein
MEMADGGMWPGVHGGLGCVVASGFGCAGSKRRRPGGSNSNPRQSKGECSAGISAASHGILRQRGKVRSGEGPRHSRSWTWQASGRWLLAA